MHPTLTHVTPSPHVIPIGVGVTKSYTATFNPNLAASLEAANPPEPPPITIISNIFQIFLEAYLSVVILHGTRPKTKKILKSQPVFHTFVGWGILKGCSIGILREVISRFLF